MEPEIEIRYFVDEPTKIIVKASNGRFSGCSEEYININWLIDLVKDLEGFPKKLSSEVNFCTNPSRPAESHFSLRFFVRDSSGHTSVQVNIRSDEGSDRVPDQCSFELRFEPGALDRFLQSAKSVSEASQGVLRLSGMPSV